MIEIYNIKVYFDSPYNAGVKHSLSVYTRISMTVCVKKGFRLFSLQIIEVRKRTKIMNRYNQV